jgi:hypothetical protein
MAGRVCAAVGFRDLGRILECGPKGGTRPEQPPPPGRNPRAAPRGVPSLQLLEALPYPTLLARLELCYVRVHALPSRVVNLHDGTGGSVAPKSADRLDVETSEQGGTRGSAGLCRRAYACASVASAPSDASFAASSARDRMPSLR